MTEERVSAGELREAGIILPSDIPDCATVARSAVRLKVTHVEHDRGTMMVTGLFGYLSWARAGPQSAANRARVSVVRR